MLTQTHEINVTTGDVVNFCPLGGCTAILCPTLTKRSDGTVSHPADGSIALVNDDGRSIIQFTAAADFDGWITITETYSIPDAVAYAAA